MTGSRVQRTAVLTRLRSTLRDLATDVGLFLLAPRCPYCEERTSDLGQHVTDQHGEVVRSRP